MKTNITFKDDLYTLKFENTDFGPYKYLFFKDNLLFDEKIGKRGSYNFPFKSSFNHNTEVFLSLDYIYLGISSRLNLAGEKQNTLDIINTTSLTKIRLYIQEISLIFNTKENDKDIIFINYLYNGICKTIKIDLDSMSILEEIDEQLSAFFYIIYNNTSKKYYKLSLQKNSDYPGNLIIEGYFYIDYEITELNEGNLNFSYLEDYIKDTDFEIYFFDENIGNYGYNFLTVYKNWEKIKDKYFYKNSILSIIIGLCGIIIIIGLCGIIMIIGLIRIITPIISMFLFILGFFGLFFFFISFKKIPFEDYLVDNLNLLYSDNKIGILKNIYINFNNYNYVKLVKKNKIETSKNYRFYLNLGGDENRILTFKVIKNIDHYILTNDNMSIKINIFNENYDFNFN